MVEIAYVSPFIPPEWIAAHGLMPRRLLPGGQARDAVRPVEAGVCSFAAAFANVTTEPSIAGTVFTTTCDAMRRIVESAEGLPSSTAEQARTRDAGAPFLFNVPATWQTVSARQLYYSELQRLGRWLVGCGGRAPDRERLVAAMCQWDDARRAARAARPFLRPRRFAEALIEMHGTGRFAATDENDLDTTGLPVALVGGPLRREELWLYDEAAAAGARIVFDALETGERGLAPQLDRRLLKDDPLRLLADTYFGQLPDAFRRPNTRLYDYLKAGFAERGVRAVVLVRRVACDFWRAEAARIRECCGLPCVDVDLTGQGDVRLRARTTLQALGEEFA